MLCMARRRYGTGSLVRRRRKFYARVWLNGQRKEIPTGYESKKDALLFLDELTLKLRKGERAAVESPTVGNLLDDLLRDYERSGRKSLPQLKRRLKHFDGLRRLKAASFRAAQAEEYKAARMLVGASPATVNRELETLRRAFRIGVENERVLGVPKFRLIDADNVREGFLEHGDYERLRDALAEPVRLMMVIAYHTGARAGAILSLRWDRVDLKGGVVLPPGAQQRNKRVGAWPIYADLERALREAKFVRDRDWPNVELVIHRSGRKLVDYRDGWSTGCKAAGLEGLRFHDLRRSAVRNLLDAGLDESSVMKIVGHRTRAMLDRYNIVSVKDVKRAAKTMDEWFESKRSDAPSKPAKPVQ